MLIMLSVIIKYAPSKYQCENSDDYDGSDITDDECDVSDDDGNIIYNDSNLRDNDIEKVSYCWI